MAHRSIAVFLDTSVLFAACYSKTGASREILRYAVRGQISLIVNKFVLAETERNLEAKHPEALPLLQVLQATLLFKIVHPTQAEVLAMQPHTAFKDAPHFATALKAKVDCLVSLDRKHMIDIREKVYADLRLRILLPSELLSELREQFDQET